MEFWMKAVGDRLSRALLILLAISASERALAGTVTYMYTDPQGTPLAEADTSGNVVATFDYKPYGSQALGTPKNGPGYTGHVNDADTALVYMQARYYDAAIGRFLSVDPKKVKSGELYSFNRFAYADDNPTLKTDPTGESTCVDKDCKMSTIDAHPAGPNGPTITFHNDNPKGASPAQPVSTETAKMVEAAVIASGVSSVNINSTTGGQHAPTSRHAGGKAVDIDTVNGKTVRGQGQSKAVQSLQKAFEQQSNSRENFGPAVMEKTNAIGGKPEHFDDPKVGEDHQGHIHESGQN
ncbi:RHS repeat domain-containing protein [Dyella jiangningensis]|uniref:Teneurin-like YD-shell domain-containing protein n=1 Tax=Dyella jiangningensis TaxID=1379159 RepID=A0A328NYH7_9GAMM|nr:RHS repeat-associated core domain-containing protein [Dyella jiangningensis]RAO75187.1 hypothetical protein CA260_13885 [Dyella jiangningensis]